MTETKGEYDAARDRISVKEGNEIESMLRFDIALALVMSIYRGK
jgi:hypothetical protein